MPFFIDNMKLDIKLILKGCFAVFVFGALIIQIIYRFVYKYEMNNCKQVIGSAMVYNVDYVPGRTTGLWVSYSFVVNGKTYGDRTNLGVGLADTLETLLLNRKFAVIYCDNNPNRSDILITPEYFKKYNIPFPDSLHGILRYIH